MYDASVSDVDNTVGTGCERAAVRDDKDRCTAAADVDEAIDDTLFRCRIDLGGWLVAEQDRRFCRECDGKSGSRRFAARKVGG
jgi:hypothetical protein